MRVLIVEDDEKLATFLKQALREDGYTVDVALTGTEGSFLARTEPYDVLVLDVLLPGKSGFQIVTEARASGIGTPALMLTARDDTASVVKSLNLGADDYVTKPFKFAELLARVRALARRSRTTTHETLQYADVELDRLQHRARRGGRALDLTPKEYQLLEHFLLHAEVVVRRTDLLERVWELHLDPDSNVVDVHVGNLRRKLVEGGGAPLLHTVRGVGFVFREDPAV